MTVPPSAGLPPLRIWPESVAASVEHVAEAGAPERVYLHDSDGRTWRVYDRAYGPPYAPARRHRTFPTVGDPRATLRWFQGRDGSARLYRFAGSDPGIADVATLEEQLLHAACRASPVWPAEPLAAYPDGRSLAAERTVRAALEPSAGVRGGPRRFPRRSRALVAERYRPVAAADGGTTSETYAQQGTR